MSRCARQNPRNALFAYLWKAPPPPRNSGMLPLVLEQWCPSASIALDIGALDADLTSGVRSLIALVSWGLFLACPVTRFGPLPAPHRACPILRHVAALLSGLLSQIEFGPLLQNARLGTWEPGLSLGFAHG
jgi:hypothetical protein